MSYLPRRKGTVDRITDGVAVVLVEEKGETVGEVHVEEESLPEDVDAGDKVLVVEETDEGGSVVDDVLVVALCAVGLFVGSVVVMSASPSTPAEPVVGMQSEPVTVAVNGLLGLSLMAVGVRLALPSLERLVNIGRTAVDAEVRKKRVRIQKLREDTATAEKRTDEKRERLRSRGRKSGFETDGGG